MKARWFKLLINCYPPYLGTGICVTRISADYRFLQVEMPLRWYNRNYVGTHFGGSLSSMTDPFYMLMLINNLGRDYIVWDQAGSIEYRKPGRGRVKAVFEIDQALLDEIKQQTAGGDKFIKPLTVDITDEAGDVVAHVSRTLYFRRKKRD
jgi:acyl-coenzyme A thioesterase PaaI-like protein